MVFFDTQPIGGVSGGQNRFLSIMHSHNLHAIRQLLLRMGEEDNRLSGRYPFEYQAIRPNIDLAAVAGDNSIVRQRLPTRSSEELTHKLLEFLVGALLASSLTLRRYFECLFHASTPVRPSCWIVHGWFTSGLTSSRTVRSQHRQRHRAAPTTRIWTLMLWPFTPLRTPSSSSSRRLIRASITFRS
jgi:hypothetical protein